MTGYTPQPQTPLAEMLDLTGRTAVVTGGAMGIGLGIARRLHEAGASLLIADLDEAAAQSAATDLAAARPGGALAIRCDVSDEESVQGIVLAAVESFGGVDILVNNSGIYPMVPLADFDAATFRRVLDVNLTGLFLCTKAASALMIEQGAGRADRQRHLDRRSASLDGRAGPLRRLQARRVGLHKNVALDLAPHGIWVNAVAPGGIKTPGTGEMDETIAEVPEGAITAGVGQFRVILGRQTMTVWMSLMSAKSWSRVMSGSW